MGTFDDATRTALHFSRVDQGYLSCYFYLKTFKNKKKIFQNTDCEVKKIFPDGSIIVANKRCKNLKKNYQLGQTPMPYMKICFQIQMVDTRYAVKNVTLAITS